MTDRGRLVYALLRTLLAWTPSPRSRLGVDLPRGFADPAQRYVSCPDCLANDRPQGMPGCETCGGQGEIPEPRKDPYDTGQDRSAFGTVGGDARRARAERDRLLRRLEQDEAVRLGEIASDDALTRSLARRDALYRKGSYRQVEMALAKLRRLDPDAYTVAMAVAYAPFGEQPVDCERDSVVAICELLGVWIDGPIYVPEFVPVSEDAELERLCREGRGALWRGRRDWHNMKRRERNAMIAAMANAGRSPTQIGLALGLTRRRVQQILADQAERSEGVATGPAA